MSGVGIIGIGHALPEKILTNDDLAKMVDTSDDWIRSRTGIIERRIARDSEGTSFLATNAARSALKSAGLSADAIDLLIVGTSTPDMPLPSCACLVQKEIQAKNAVCFDLAAACAGFNFSLATAQQFIASGMYRYALVIGAERISPYIDWTDRSTCVLFGDAAGACVVSQVAGRGIIASHMGSDGNLAELIAIPGGGSLRPASPETVAKKQHYLKMNGSEVFKFAVRCMTSSIEEVLKRSGVSLEDIACVIPHQANRRIIDAICERLKIPLEKVFVNLEKYGNTSSASVVLALSEAVEAARIKKGDLVMLTTFGAGLVWGSTILEWGR